MKYKKFLSLQLRGPEGKKYYYVNLCKNNQQKACRVHRLIALTFIPNPNNLPCVNHLDCNKLNNNVSNLEWCTYKENNHYDNRILKSIETRKKNGYCVKVAICNKTTHETIKEFDSVRDAIHFLNLSDSASSNISAVIKGRRKSAYGYFCKNLE